MPDDSWLDGLGQDSFKDYAAYMAQLSKEFVDALQAKGFNREEAMRLTIAIIPGGFKANQG